MRIREVECLSSDDEEAEIDNCVKVKSKECKSNEITCYIGCTNIMNDFDKQYQVTKILGEG